jgi:hypothetical protein
MLRLRIVCQWSISETKIRNLSLVNFQHRLNIINYVNLNILFIHITIITD